MPPTSVDCGQASQLHHQREVHMKCMLRSGGKALFKRHRRQWSVFGTRDEDAAAVYLATWVAGGETLASNSCMHRVSSTGGRPSVFGHTVFLQAVP